MDMKVKAEQYRSYLTDDVIPFWLKYGIDNEQSGFLTCVDRDGSLFSEDKSVWFQGRGTWVFSKMYNCIEKKQEYLQAAKSGYDFLKKCYDTDGRMFFTVTRDGKPIQKRRYYFSETFAAIACAEYYAASGDDEALELSRTTFDLIEKLYRKPELSPPKYNTDNLRIKALSIPMILLSTTQVLRTHDKERADFYNGFITEMLDEILKSGFYNTEKKALFEFISPNDEPLKGPKSRLVNPGHSLEAAWFISIEALRLNDDELMNKALNIIDWSLETGWDNEYGGVYSFVDIEGKPAEQLEWDMKLWWPHTEALYATALAWKITNKTKYSEWFEKINEYSFTKFSDKEHGEWYGYLHRDGTVSNSLKGNIFKGPFHLPRALILLNDLLECNDIKGYFPL